MVSCPKCVINNTLDSAFCKKCGAILPISMIEEEQQKLKEIVAKGMESYQSGNLDEAFAIADHSILTNPSYGEAYALKGLVLERKRNYAEALDAYETVVALNPDSAMDKIKLNQLRNAFASRQAGEPKMDRKGAALMAVGVSTLVIAISGVVYGIAQSSKETKSALSNNAPTLQNSNYLANVKSNNQPGVNQPINPNKPGTDPGYVPPVQDNKAPGDTAVRRSSNGDRTVGIADPEPFSVDGPKGPVGSNLPDPNKQNNPNPVNHNPVSKPPIDNGGGDPPPTASTGVIDISFSKPKSETPAGAAGTDQSRSSSAGKMYQRQGQTSQRSGKTAQARTEYQKAIDAYQKEIDSGKGDKDAATAGINTSRQALKNLKD